MFALKLLIGLVQIVQGESKRSNIVILLLLNILEAFNTIIYIKLNKVIK